MVTVFGQCFQINIQSPFVFFSSNKGDPDVHLSLSPPALSEYRVRGVYSHIFLTYSHG
ncbi:hypothetical protein RO3G_01581 [Rhizopus delemar RA 99-880]|uniref:Uncharacterized protein n=1 Tax=Rhizopus delemar (strain RA 99-880 / ATCC MYA-4621 / FGSC 9543 / NRRL 43880) TaxID=246409 RepID=I1BKZ7_RHIO9|nr:hypothetical protein RO3G_01581 [Rhizopus delemar RA 99-880]|eukprot:EIE76877.1 hypothetical protein RO3G_01581 [Rhizopus delemar RA 99-880]